ncbi:hypothetical protein OG555_19210 [Kribbella sp. NBC_01484]|uniref:hypothetical protein n=1 Tax=Kribbella sp. NBC_01484 TaxID=2903579 RepID=UPI002E35BB66|nr:hypothetical protein [Kribbella sp. NBC_01484]
MTLLPPKVVGPITELSTFVTVLGAIDGAVVQLLANNAPVGIPATAHGLSVDVPLGGVPLAAGVSVTATQAASKFLLNDVSPPSPVGEPVGGAPTSLPPVVFLSILHPCADWAFVGGTVPGVTVELVWNGQMIGTALSTSTTVSVPIAFPPGASPGQTVMASQSATVAGRTVRGPAVESPPLEASPNRDAPPPTVTPPYECDLAVLVSGLLEGASLTVKVGADEFGGYPFVGTPVWVGVPRAVKPVDQVSAKQESTTCHRSSGFTVPPVGVNAPPDLPAPAIVGPICPNAVSVEVRNLRPGADVWIEALKDPDTGLIIDEDLGHIQAWATECDFPLPAGWADRPGIAKYPGKFLLQFAESLCNKRAPVVTYPIAPLPGAVGTPTISPAPIECSRYVNATGLTAGAHVVVHSDQTDLPTLSPSYPITGSQMTLELYRPLRWPEKVWLSQSGCSVAADSAQVDVQVFKGLPQPVIETPVRIPRGGFTARQLMPGARAYVRVNGALRPGVDVTTDRMFFPVPGLGSGRDDHVTLQQTMCTKQSIESSSEPVTQGVMKVGVTPSTIQRGVPTSITVTAADADTGQPVGGVVRIAGAVVGPTGTPFGYLFALGQPAPPATVEAVGYEPSAITFNLVDPPPASTGTLHLSVNNNYPGILKITSITWSLWRQNLNSFTLVSTVTEKGTSTTMKPSPNGQYHIHADVWVDNNVSGYNEVAEFRGNQQVNGTSTLEITWSGSDQSRAFRLFTETQIITAGGTTTTVVNPVVAL